MMIHAYDENYLENARESLATMLDFGVNGLGMELEAFYRKFLDSPVADKFAYGDTTTLAGKSGIELALEIVGEEQEEREAELEKYLTSPYGSSREYWTGWALAYFQWASGMDFEQIESVISIQDICFMYSPYHEMDISRFCDRMLAYVNAVKKGSALKRLRMYRNLSQSQLAKLSGVPVRTIQQYEQGQKDIKHCYAETLIRLAKALYCEPEELLAGCYEFSEEEK